MLPSKYALLCYTRYATRNICFTLSCKISGSLNHLLAPFISTSSCSVYSTSVPLTSFFLHPSIFILLLFHFKSILFISLLLLSSYSISAILTSIHLYQTLFIPPLSNSLHYTSIKLSSLHLYQTLFIPPLSYSFHLLYSLLAFFHLFATLFISHLASMIVPFESLFHSSRITISSFHSHFLHNNKSKKKQM